MAIGIGLTKKLTSTGVISTASKSAIVRAITLRSGTTASSILIKDGGTSGTEKWGLSLAATTAAGDTVASINFCGGNNNTNGGIVCSTDAYGTLAGTGAIAYILYDEIQA